MTVAITHITPPETYQVICARHEAGHAVVAACNDIDLCGQVSIDSDDKNHGGSVMPCVLFEVTPPQATYDAAKWYEALSRIPNEFFVAGYAGTVSMAAGEWRTPEDWWFQYSHGTDSYYVILKWLASRHPKRFDELDRVYSNYLELNVNDVERSCGRFVVGTSDEHVREFWHALKADLGRGAGTLKKFRVELLAFQNEMLLCSECVQTALAAPRNQTALNAVAEALLSRKTVPASEIHDLIVGSWHAHDAAL